MQAAISPASAVPDFRHVNVWIFDLDNTLYRAETGIFAQIEARMTEFVQQSLGLGFEEARRLQKEYYLADGTTMNGLVRRHGIDPEAYLAFVHEIDLSGLSPDTVLSEALARLPGRRFVFTNGCRNHTTRILDRLALAHLFEECWDIRTLGNCPKPRPEAYGSVLARVPAVPGQCAMFDDIARNLAPAHALGCTTVWVNAGNAQPEQASRRLDKAQAQIDYETDDLCRFLQTIRI